MSEQGDPYHLERFVDAQRGVIDGALRELRAGYKTGHWMWFVFPQLAGLGRSEHARFYGITSLAEARAYLAHPELGPRLHACVDAVLGVRDRSAVAVLGSIDAVKLRSSMTLFHRAAPEDPAFFSVLVAWYAGSADPVTEAMLADGADEETP